MVDCVSDYAMYNTQKDTVNFQEICEVTTKR